MVELGAGDVEWDCHYFSVAACAPNVIAGNRGFCAINPYYSPAPTTAAMGTKRARIGAFINNSAGRLSVFAETAVAHCWVQIAMRE